MAIEIVSWQDAHFSLDDEQHKEDFIVRTVGEVTERGKWLRIVSEVTPDGERGITYVPKVNVVKRQVLLVPRH